MRFRKPLTARQVVVLTLALAAIFAALMVAHAQGSPLASTS